MKRRIQNQINLGCIAKPYIGLIDWLALIKKAIGFEFTKHQIHQAARLSRALLHAGHAIQNHDDALTITFGRPYQPIA